MHFVNSKFEINFSEYRCADCVHTESMVTDPAVESRKGYANRMYNETAGESVVSAESPQENTANPSRGFEF